MASQDKHNLYDILLQLVLYRIFDHLTLTYLLTTASKLKQCSLKFQ